MLAAKYYRPIHGSERRHHSAWTKVPGQNTPWYENKATLKAMIRVFTRQWTHSAHACEGLDWTACVSCPFRRGTCDFFEECTDHVVASFLTALLTSVTVYFDCGCQGSPNTNWLSDPVFPRWRPWTGRVSLPFPCMVICSLPKIFSVIWMVTDDHR